MNDNTSNLDPRKVFLSRRFESEHSEFADRSTLPKPNTIFVDAVGNRYRTDDLGRTAVAEGFLQLGEATKRNEHAQKTTPEKIPGADHAGHFLAHSLGGLDGRINLAAQNGNLNQGDYKSMENLAAKEMEAGHFVYRSVKVQYDGDSTRPTHFIVTDTVLDKQGNPIHTHNHTFVNQTKDERKLLVSEAEKANKESVRNEKIGRAVKHYRKKQEVNDAFGENKAATKKTNGGFCPLHMIVTFGLIALIITMFFLSKDGYGGFLTSALAVLAPFVIVLGIFGVMKKFPTALMNKAGGIIILILTVVLFILIPLFKIVFSVALLACVIYSVVKIFMGVGSIFAPTGTITITKIDEDGRSTVDTVHVYGGSMDSEMDSIEKNLRAQGYDDIKRD